jgi:hypothetical protein
VIETFSVLAPQMEDEKIDLIRAGLIRAGLVLAGPRPLGRFQA